MSGMLTVPAPAATTARDDVDRGSRPRCAPPSSAENSTSSTYLRASSTARPPSSSDLALRLLQLVLEVDVAGGQEGVDARRAVLGLLQRLGGALDVERRAARQRRHLDGHLGGSPRCTASKSPVRGDGEPRLQDVHAQLGELVRHAHLLGHGHAAAGRLLAVAQGGVEDVDAFGTSPWASIWRTGPGLRQIYNYSRGR